LRSRSKWVDDVDDVEVPFDLRLLVMPSLLCRHSCRHLFQAWCIGNSRPPSQIFPERPRGLRGGSMRSFGIEIPGLCVTGPQRRVAPQTQQAPRSSKTPKRKQPNNNNKPPISCRFPAGYLEGGSPQLPGCTPPPLTLSPETLFTGTGPVLLFTLQSWQVQTGRYGALLCHGI
jgi:hypothetical protein